MLIKFSITLLLLLLLLSPRTIEGFLIPSPSSNTMKAITRSGIRCGTGRLILGMAKKKGFGSNSSPPQTSKKRTSASVTGPVPRVDEDFSTTQMTTSVADIDKKKQSQPVEDVSRGKLAVEKMRRERAEQRNAELSKMKQVQDVDQLVRETGGEAAVIPEKVAQRVRVLIFSFSLLYMYIYFRFILHVYLIFKSIISSFKNSYCIGVHQMGKRMLPFVGIPLLGGMGSFVGFWYMATYKDMEFQPVLVAGTTIALLVIGLVGITYSMLSSSWDENREGSLLGTDEFSRNIDNIKGGLNRSRDNAQIREQIMIEENQQQKKATISSNKKQSLAEKLGDGMD